MALTSKIGLLLTISFYGVAALLSGVSHAQAVVTYDDFNGQFIIDGNKWYGNEQSGGVDVIRRAENSEVTLAFGAYGDSNSDTGRTNLRNRLHFEPTTGVDLSSVTTVSFDGTIKVALTEDCIANPEGADVELRWIRQFFNDGSSTGPDDATGDIGGFMRMRVNSDGSTTIDTNIYRCTDAPCNESIDITYESFPTGFSLGETKTLGVLWQPSNDLFTFVVDQGLPSQEIIIGSYNGYDDSAPAVQEFMYIGNRVRVPNCSEGRKRAGLLSTIDNVRLNSEAIRVGP